ncbi:MAG: bifunctional N(6)-L-threonylcarbamoyladenine synthase/serine/threonine protein kinase [Candidatus Nanoarchaeia archaeon]
MICLGIESTAHTFGVGIVDFEGNVLANVRDAFTTEEGGMVPWEVAAHHVDICQNVVKKALEKAGITMSDVDLISYSQSPGMGNCLRIGCHAAKTLHLKYDKPVVGVNHCIAHLEIGKLRTGAKDPVLLYASGANTQVIALEGGKYRVFGETLDGGIGNFLDQFARELGLGFPGGPKIEALAKKGGKYIPLPYTVKGMDVSFGGLFTNIKRKYHSGEYSKVDIAFSVQETIFAMLVEVSERAMAHCGKTELVIGGGVGCNKRLQEMCKMMCEERGGTFYAPENEFLIDNGAMIAWQGVLQYKAGEKLEIEKIDVDPYLRTDDVAVTW